MVAVILIIEHLQLLNAANKSELSLHKFHCAMCGNNGTKTNSTYLTTTKRIHYAEYWHTGQNDTNYMIWLCKLQNMTVQITWYVYKIDGSSQSSEHLVHIIEAT